MESDKLILDERPEGIGNGPIFVGSYKPGDRIETWEIEEGNQVVLKSSGITVIANVIEAQARNYRGEVIGFENYMEESLHGVKPGDIIEFSHAHVIGCSR